MTFTHDIGAVFVRLCRLYKEGAVSFIAMNLHSERSAKLKLSENLRELVVHEYLFSPEGSITSRYMS